MRYDDYDYNEYDVDDHDRRWPRIVTILLAVAALAAIGTVIYRSTTNDDGNGSTRFASGAPSSVSDPTSSDAFGLSTAISSALESTSPRVQVLPPELPSTTEPGPTDDAASTDSTSRSGTTASASPPSPASTPVATTSTAADPDASTTTSAATDADATSTTVATTAPPGGAGPTPSVPAGTPYPTESDGTARPIVVIFDTTTITLTGQVPSQAAADRLAVLAVANSQFPASVVNNLLINPAVPIGVGVRVIELNSPRFPERSSTILPAHAAELDRVANVMKALPNLTVLVVGHADQRGSETGNYAISDARARAVVNYLVYVGIAPSRLSSRAVGASDLLAAGDDATSLALNRRTEFIFYGLLVE